MFNTLWYIQGLFRFLVTRKRSLWLFLDIQLLFGGWGILHGWRSCRFTDYLQTHVFNYLWCLSNGKIKNVTRPLIIFFEVTYSMNSTCKIAIQQLHILQSVVEITNWFRFSQDMQYTWTLDFVVSIEYYLIPKDYYMGKYFFCPSFRLKIANVLKF